MNKFLDFLLLTLNRSLIGSIIDTLDNTLKLDYSLPNALRSLDNKGTRISNRIICIGYKYKSKRLLGSTKFKTALVFVFIYLTFDRLQNAQIQATANVDAT